MQLHAAILALSWPTWAEKAECLTAIAAVVGLVGVLLAYKELRQSRKTARGEFFLHVYELLQDYNDLHNRLRAGDWPKSESESPKDWNQLRRYMGLIELVQIWLDDGLIDLKSVDRVVSHRLAVIINNDAIQEAELKHPEFWQDFLRLWKRLEEEGRVFHQFKPRHKPP